MQSDHRPSRHFHEDDPIEWRRLITLDDETRSCEAGSSLPRSDPPALTGETSPARLQVQIPVGGSTARQPAAATPTHGKPRKLHKFLTHLVLGRFSHTLAEGLAEGQTIDIMNIRRDQDETLSSEIFALPPAILSRTGPGSASSKAFS